jgi:hypothetical protein
MNLFPISQTHHAQEACGSMYPKTFVAVAFEILLFEIHSTLADWNFDKSSLASAFKGFKLFLLTFHHSLT